MIDLNDTRGHRKGNWLWVGDTLHPQNVADILAMLPGIHAECTGKDIGVWAG